MTGLSDVYASVLDCNPSLYNISAFAHCLHCWFSVYAQKLEQRKRRMTEENRYERLKERKGNNKMETVKRNFSLVNPFNASWSKF